MNIPDIILRKVQVAMKLKEEEFQSYLTLLKTEAEAYVMNFFVVTSVDENVKNICIDLHVQYTLFSKIEYERVAEDKLRTLHEIIDAFNTNYEKRRPIVRGGVTFL